MSVSPDALAELDFENQPPGDEQPPESAPEGAGQPPAAPPPAPPAEGEPPAEGDTPAPWWAKYGQTEEDAREAIANLDSLRGRQANELGELRARMEQYERQPREPQAQQPQADEQDPLSPQALFTPDEIAGLQEMAEDYPLMPQMLYDARRALVEMRMQFQEALTPVAQSMNQQQAAQAIDRLTQEFGDDVMARNRETLARALEADADYFVDPRTRHERLRMALITAEHDNQGSRQNGGGGQARARDAQGRYIPEHPGQPVTTAFVEGGSGPQPPAGGATEVDPEVAAIDEVAARSHDAFGRRGYH